VAELPQAFHRQHLENGGTEVDNGGKQLLGKQQKQKGEKGKLPMR